VPFTPGSPSSLPTHIKADIHTQPSKTSASASAQGQRAAGDERGFRTPTSASARRSGRPSRQSPARRGRLFVGRPVGGEGRRRSRGGDISSTNQREIDRNPLDPPPFFIHQELYIARARARLIQSAAAPRQFHSVSEQQLFFCLPTHHPQGRK
jgi:hypothetical protein